MGGVIMNERMDTPLEGLRRDLMGVVMNERMDTPLEGLRRGAHGFFAREAKKKEGHAPAPAAVCKRRARTRTSSCTARSIW